MRNFAHNHPFITAILMGVTAIPLLGIAARAVLWTFIIFDKIFNNVLNEGVLWYIVLISPLIAIVLPSVATRIFTKSNKAVAITVLVTLVSLAGYNFLIYPIINHYELEKQYPGYQEIDRIEEEIDNSVLPISISVEEIGDGSYIGSYRVWLSLSSKQSGGFLIKLDYRKGGEDYRIVVEEERILEEGINKIEIKLPKDMSMYVGNITPADEVRVSILKEVAWETEYGNVATLDVSHTRFANKSGTWIPQEEFNPTVIH